MPSESDHRKAIDKMTKRIIDSTNSRPEQAREKAREIARRVDRKQREK